MSWHFDQNTLNEFLSNSEHTDWIEWKALSHYSKIKKQFSSEHHDLSRLGSFNVMEFTGTEGLQCCMLPLEGHPKILGSLSRIKLFDRNAKLYFEGIWSEVSLPVIQTHSEFYVWLEHKSDRLTRSKPKLSQRLMGMWRYFRHRSKK